ncbi:MAG: hypothetical protein M9913_21160 [Bryobacteraceae bacterium]|jgi:hypothetical protein|nr:hypothetical protein [Solibacteraceae bacterium]MCL4843721.1 hypothetical protein [Bryobacteraceae bacterium]MCO5353359.1 hypothetical protein [Bryobacteraceae bacterium]HAX41012.1 hypothetical protein [Bryobacterales bacterium]HRJ20912.1 hypothetical protein [Bryobacteraceae bacterium]
MIYRRRKNRGGLPGGFFSFTHKQRHVYGSGDGDFIRLRDERGQEWYGMAERMEDDSVRYRFRDPDGNYISGISDGYGVILRDAKGNTWRGFID